MSDEVIIPIEGDVSDEVIIPTVEDKSDEIIIPIEGVVPEGKNKCYIHY